jgi:RNA polymerase sigma factor (sigma-70 family)
LEAAAKGRPRRVAKTCTEGSKSLDRGTPLTLASRNTEYEVHVAVAPSPHDDAPHAVELLYRQHAVALRAFCRRHVGADDADEVVQTTFLRALRALNRGERPYAERAWLLTIARNVCASRATSAVRRHELLDPRALEDASEDATDDVVDADLAAALRSLPDGQRRAFVLRAVHELSYDEIAAELDVSRAAVESWIFRARRKLASAVGERRRRLALDLSSAAGAAKSLVAGSAVKIAAVTVVAGTALAVGPATADRPSEAPAQQLPVPLQTGPAPAERPRSAPSEPRRVRATRPTSTAAPSAPERVGPRAESPPVTATATPVAVAPAESPETPGTKVAPGDEPTIVESLPELESPALEVTILNVPLLDSPSLELPALDSPTVEVSELLSPLPTVEDATAVLTPILP